LGILIIEDPDSIGLLARHHPSALIFLLTGPKAGPGEYRVVMQAGAACVITAGMRRAELLDVLDLAQRGYFPFPRRLAPSVSARVEEPPADLKLTD
jgi:hypothetical protein